MHHIPLTGLVSYSLLFRHRNDVYPAYDQSGQTEFFTNVQEYLFDKIKVETNRMGVKKSFCVELCLYKTLVEDGNFYL
jgi:hypothetical protein